MTKIRTPLPVREGKCQPHQQFAIFIEVPVQDFEHKKNDDDGAGGAGGVEGGGAKGAGTEGEACSRKGSQDQVVVFQLYLVIQCPLGRTETDHNNLKESHH